MSAPIATGVFVYPLKSARAIAVERCVVEMRGLAGDRRWMVVDNDGKMISQREASALARVDVVRTADGITLASDGHGSCAVAQPAAGAPRRTVEVWGDRVAAAIASAAAGAWLGAVLGRPVSLVHLPDDVVRPVDLEYGRPGEQVTFADGFPLLVTSEASLVALERAVGAPVPMDRFRPNLVVRGTEAWDEDRWRRLRVGSVWFRVAKPCARCVITTLDQQSGVGGAEPLRTLARIRRTALGALFGQNVVPETAGALAIGDPVEIEAF